MLGVAAVIVAGATAFAVITLFGDDDDSAGPDAEATEQALETAEDQADAARCERQLEGFLSSLEELDSRLNVGLNFNEYSTQVGDIQVEYDRVPFNALDVDCVGEVGVSAEKAFNAYATAQSVWSDCFDSLSCSNSEIDPELQRQWAKAAGLVAAARRGLASMRRP